MVIFALGFIFHTGWPINNVPILLTTILMGHPVCGRGTYENKATPYTGTCEYIFQTMLIIDEKYIL